MGVLYLVLGGWWWRGPISCVRRVVVVAGVLHLVLGGWWWGSYILC